MAGTNKALEHLKQIAKQSRIQVNAIASFIDDTVREECEETPFHIERSDMWTLVDYVNIVVHIFQKDNRKFYDLESLWADAQREDHNE